MLGFAVERAGAEAAAIHRTERPHVADRVEAEAVRPPEDGLILALASLYPPSGVGSDRPEGPKAVP